MLKFLFPGGGQKVNLSDIKDLHDEFIAVKESLIVGVGGCVLSGLVVSGTEGSANISAGWCYLDGEYVYLPAQTAINFTANPTQYIQKATPVESRPKNFVIGGLKNTRTTTNAEIVTALPVGDYIAMSFTGHSQSYVEVLAKKIEPVGTIKMCNSVATFDTGTGLGSGAWQGWSLCNGQNGTIDLRGRVPVQLDPADVDYNAVSKNGGQKSVTLTANQSGVRPHTHPVNDPGHSHSITQQMYAESGTTTNHIADGGNALGASLSINTNASYAGISVQNAAASSALEAHENRQPYRVVAFVQKIA